MPLSLVAAEASDEAPLHIIQVERVCMYGWGSETMAGLGTHVVDIQRGELEAATIAACLLRGLDEHVGGVRLGHVRRP